MDTVTEKWSKSIVERLIDMVPRGDMKEVSQYSKGLLIGIERWSKSIAKRLIDMVPRVIWDKWINSQKGLLIWYQEWCGYDTESNTG